MLWEKEFLVMKRAHRPWRKGGGVTYRERDISKPGYEDPILSRPSDSEFRDHHCQCRSVIIFRAQVKTFKSYVAYESRTCQESAVEMLSFPERFRSLPTHYDRLKLNKP